MTVLILNIHGFMGVADNKNFQALQGICQGEQLISPQLDYLQQPPGQILAALAAVIQRTREPVLLVGQSLGGWFANQLSLRFLLPCVLTNPCLNPNGCEIITHSAIPRSYLRDYRQESCPVRNPMAHILCSRQDEVLPHNLPLCRALTHQVRLVNGDHSGIENRTLELKAILDLWKARR